MLRFSAALGTALFLIASGSAQAQSNHSGMNMMAGQDGGQKTAENPAHRYLLTVCALPEMETELGLSAQQIAQLRQYKQDYLARPADYPEAVDLAAAEAAGTMEALLTPQQLAKLAALQPADLHQIAMGRIPEAEMTKLMDLMQAKSAEKPSKMHCEMMMGGKDDVSGESGSAHHH
jgi:hypothetical protein